MQKNFSIGSSISEGCNVINKNWLALLGAVIVTGVVSWCLQQIGAPTIDPSILSDDMDFEDILNLFMEFNPYASVGFWLNLLFTMLAYAGIGKMIINGVDGKKVDFNAFKMPVSTYLNFIGVYIIWMVIVTVGTMLCIIPGLFLGIRLGFAPLYVIDRDMECISALKASWDDTAGNWWHLFGADLVIVLFMLVGYLLCCVGFFYTYPAGLAALFVIYRVISGGEDVEMVEEKE